MSRATQLGGESQPHQDPGPLFARARASDPETAKDAARDYNPGPLAAALLEALRASGDRGLTSLEAAMILAPVDIDPVAFLQSLSPRFANLRDAGKAEVVGKRNRRQVWRAV